MMCFNEFIVSFPVFIVIKQSTNRKLQSSHRVMKSEFQHQLRSGHFGQSEMEVSKVFDFKVSTYKTVFS